MTTASLLGVEGGTQVRSMAKGSRGRSRSAITGRFVKASTAKRHPKTTVTEKGK